MRKKWKSEKTDILLLQFNKVWSAPLIYTGSKCNSLTKVIMYKCMRQFFRTFHFKMLWRKIVKEEIYTNKVFC